MLRHSKKENRMRAPAHSGNSRETWFLVAIALRPADSGQGVIIREVGTIHFGAENAIRIAP
jgi:hypothetical protein